MPLPSPINYSTWQEFASALISALGDGSSDVVAGLAGAVSGGSGSAPPGFVSVWADETTKDLYYGNPFFTPPPAPDIVQVDTLNLALASVELQTIADGAVGTNKLIDLAVVNEKIANAAILSAKIGDLQVVTAKIDDLAVNSAKIADASIDSAKIADAAILTAHIGLAQVITADIATANITSALIADASIQTADIGAAQITTALIANAAITSALILNATILQADIGAAQIGTAQIQSAAITAALIAVAAIGTAAIQDASITNAKIVDLVVTKLSSGTLGASIDVSGGSFQFTTGAYTLYVGNGFGTSNQFFIWYGPTPAAIGNCAESGSIFYLRIDGSAYFGGSLAAGVLRTTAQTSDTSSSASVQIGDFSSNGGTISSFVSYSYNHTFRCNHGTGSTSGTGTATIVLESSNNSGTGWTTLTTLNVSITGSVIVDGDPSIQDIVQVTGGGTATIGWTPGALTTLRLRARMTGLTLPTATGTTITGNVITQNVAVSSTE